MSDLIIRAPILRWANIRICSNFSLISYDLINNHLENTKLHGELTKVTLKSSFLFNLKTNFNNIKTSIICNQLNWFYSRLSILIYENRWITPSILINMSVLTWSAASQDSCQNPSIKHSKDSILCYSYLNLRAYSIKQ